MMSTHFLYFAVIYFVVGAHGDEGKSENVKIIPIAHEEEKEVFHDQLLMLQKLPVRMISIFGSSTINAKSDHKFYIEFSNSTEVTSQPLWWKAFFLSESYVNLKKKVSPFEILYFQIKFVNPNSTKRLLLNIHFTAFDTRNVGCFVAGILLFFAAKPLSRSVVFHYTSGASIGMLMSWMIILVLLYKLIPYRRTMTTLVVTGTGAGFYFTELVFTKGYQLVLQYPYEAVGICSLFASISMALIYYFGPPSTEKSYNLIQWFLQVTAVYLIYQSSYCKEFAITAIITVAFLQFISLYTVLVKLFILITPRRLYYWYNRPPERRFLTLEEYEEQGVIETAKALKDLSDYCSSPECNSWKVVSKLKDPKRFANFLTNKEHFTKEELDLYDTFEATDEDYRLENSFNGETDSAVSFSRGSGDWLTDDEARGSSASL